MGSLLQFTGIQGQELWNKRREQAVILQCKHRMHSTSMICVCIYGILPRVLVDCKRRFVAFITAWSTSLCVIHSTGKGWPSASHLISLHLWTSLLLSTTFLSDRLSFCLQRTWCGLSWGHQMCQWSDTEHSKLLLFGSTGGCLSHVGARVSQGTIFVWKQESLQIYLDDFTR